MSVPSLAIGTIVAGRYTVHAMLGKRNGRVTYHAITAPNRHVALKLIDPILAGTEAEAALTQAATVAADLPEGAVLHVLDRGVDGDSGAPFYVSTLSDHPSLEAFVSLCPLSLNEMATMARSLARGLDAAHRRGLAHLALRPTNVFVGPPPVCWTRVGDFGCGAIDRALGEGSDRDTLAFAAPELYAGAPASLSIESAARADVFSAALLCFYAAAGDTYWKATRRRGGAAPGSDVESLARETMGVRAPASVAAREIGVTWDPKLDAAFARALSKEPSARFASVGEFGDALAEALGLPRFGGAMALTDSLVKGDKAPQTVHDDDEPATRLVPASIAPALSHAGVASVAPPPDSIAPASARMSGRSGLGGAGLGSGGLGSGGLGGTMIMDPPREPRARGGTMIIDGPRTGAPPEPSAGLFAGPHAGALESAAPGPHTSAGLVSAVPPPAGIPSFGSSSAYPLPGPHPHAPLLADPPTPDAMTAAAAARGSGRGPLLAAAIAGAAILAVGTFLLVRDPAAGDAATGASASARSPASGAAAERSAPTPNTPTAPTATESSEPVASATASPTAPPAAPAGSAPEGPIPTTFGQQPKPRVDQLDPPTTWYAELVVMCEPACDLVLVQGGPEPNPSQPKQLPPGTYIVTVKQSGGVQSQQALLRAATRTTLTFDGKLALPEKPAGWKPPPCGGFLKPCK